MSAGDKCSALVCLKISSSQLNFWWMLSLDIVTVTSFLSFLSFIFSYQSLITTAPLKISCLFFSRQILRFKFFFLSFLSSFNNMYPGENFFLFILFGICRAWLYGLISFVSFQFSPVAQLCLTLCDPMNHSTPGLPVHHQLPEFIQTHVHQVGDAIQPSHPLSSPSPPASNPSQHQSLFQWVNSSHEVAKILEFQL